MSKDRGRKEVKKPKKPAKDNPVPSAYIKSKMKSYIKEEEVTTELKAMMSDGSYHITPGYSIDTETYPDHVVPFIEAHLNYLKSHHQVDPEHYLANLRLMLKIR